MIQVQTKTQDVKTFPHGFVLGEYSEETHIFDSPWYHSKLEAYGRPSDVDVAMAMEAQRRARKGVPTRAMKDLIDILVAGVSKGEDDKEVKEVEEVIVGIPLAAPSEKAKTNTKIKQKPKAKEKAKPKANVNADPIVTVPTPPTEALSPVCTTIPKGVFFVESMDEPMEVEIIRIMLKRFDYNGVQFWKDIEQETLYERMADGSKGNCIGHWDPVRECIMDV
jgi:hypothetical protein